MEEQVIESLRANGLSFRNHMKADFSSPVLRSPLNVSRIVSAPRNAMATLVAILEEGSRPWSGQTLLDRAAVRGKA